ncbi:MAG: hypothetical protein FJZ13_04160 [Candidatus Omnitrophica bacterium]|nr:hypothetical protein [Candidatus Omnitrophota bacterium]
MFIRLNKGAQSTLEYAVIIAVVVAGLVAMQVYIKRGFQGRLRQASDDIGEQFSPGNTTGTTTTTSSVTSEETVTGGAAPVTTTSSTQTQTRSGNENVADSTQEDWVK